MLKYLFGEVHFNVVHLVKDHILEAENTLPADQVNHVIMEKVALSLPHLTLGGGDADGALLEKGAREHAWPAGELHLLVSLLDQPEGVEHHNRALAQEDAEDVSIAFSQSIEAPVEVAWVDERNISHKWETRRAW